MNCCDGCKGKSFMTVMSTAKCGHHTGRGGMQLCNDCAKKKGACEACGKPLAPPAVDDDDIPPHTD